MKYDIAIIGSGIAGATLASRLDSGQSVCILEAERTMAYHSTGRSAAMYIKNYGNQPIRHLTKLSESYFTEPSLLFSDNKLLSTRGELVICTPGQEARWQKRRLEFPEAPRISINEACELAPLLKKSCVVDAVYDALAADIDVDLFYQCAIKQAKRNGTEILLHHSVTQLKKFDNGWKITVLVDGKVEKNIEADVVVNAAGAWAQNIGELAGASNQKLQPMRRSAALIKVPKEYSNDSGPLFASVEENWYAKPQSGQLLVSPAEEIPVEAHDAYVDDMIMAEGLYRFESVVNMTVTRIEHQWAGLRTFTKDRTPVMGYDDSVENFFWLAGQGGYGIQTAPALSILAANALQKKSLEFLGDDVKSRHAIDDLIKQLSPNRDQG